MLHRTLFFLTGIVLFQQFSQFPNIYMLVFIGMMLAVCLYKQYYSVLCFLLGFSWAIGYAFYISLNPFPVELESKPLTVQGYITGLPQKTSRRWRFDFVIEPKQQQLPNKIRLSWYEPKQQVYAGQYWQFNVKLKRPHGMLNPRGFDYEQWLFAQKIKAVGYVQKSSAKFLNTTKNQQIISLWRQKIAEHLDNLLENSQYKGLIKALAIGQRDDISDEQWLLLRNTGTVHLMAISGLHVGLVAAMAYFLSQFFLLRLGVFRVPPHIIAAYISLLCALLYSALAGFAIPTQRALLMLSVVVFANIYQRHLKLIQILCVALIIILIFDPLSVLSSGFWLSFLAVTVILYTQSKRLAQSSRFFRICKIHFLIAFGLTPLLVFFFQQISIIAPIANFVAVPVISFIVIPCVLISVPLLFLHSEFAQWVLSIIEKILAAGMYWLNELNQLSFAHLPYSHIEVWQVLSAMMGILLLLAPKGFPAKVLSVFLFFPILFIEQPKIKAGEFKMTLLDVGQGLATVIETSKHLLVFDTGAKYSEKFDIGKIVLLPFLHSFGFKNIDVLIISHGDNDHIGGANALLKNMRVGRIYTSVTDKLKPQNAVNCMEGQSWQWDDVSFEMLSPAKQYVSENNNSCVLKVSSKYGSVLLTGDIEAQTEHYLLRKNALQLKSEILIAPHHGSKTSSTISFLQAVKPQWVLIPAGYKNRFNFPHQKVLNRYQQQKIDWLTTAKEGAITANINQQGIFISSYRKQYRRYWHHQD